ncbi:MAG: hypothetical protein H5T44_00345 [Thermoplasmatales archaeon]|nr:hypothetical protein [Thermoplasmatales archaeon]
MAILYLDVETFSDGEFKFGNTKIISIQVQYEDNNGRINISKEWKDGEEQILKGFYEYLKNLLQTGDVTIIGHNLLRFDIPMLIHRMAHNNIDSYENLMDLFHNFFVIDNMQCSLPEFKFKGLGAEEEKRFILYLDIETFSKRKKFKFGNTKIISIQYKRSKGKLNILKEWKVGEKQILKDFYDYLKNLLQTGKSVTIIGHNLLRFDIPMLIHRMAHNNIDSYENLMDLFFHNIFIIDTMQCLLPFNKFRFKGLCAEELAKKLKISKPKYKNSEIPDFYKGKEFNKIEEHIIADMKFIKDLWRILTKEPDKLKLLLTEEPDKLKLLK